VSRKPIAMTYGQQMGRPTRTRRPATACPRHACRVRGRETFWMTDASPMPAHPDAETRSRAVVVSYLTRC